MKMSISGLSLNQISLLNLRNTAETSVVLGVYIVFQLALSGSLLSTHSQSPSEVKSNCGHGISWVPLHVYLSVFACGSTLLAFAFAFITETRLDFTQRRLLLLQNVCAGLVNTGSEDTESGGSPCSGCLSYKDYISPYRLALSISVLVFPVLIFNTSKRLLC